MLFPAAYASSLYVTAVASTKLMSTMPGVIRPILDLIAVSAGTALASVTQAPFKGATLLLSWERSPLLLKIIGYLESV